MDRRSFARSLALSFPLLAAAPSFSRRKRILPRRLQAGDTVGLITPGSFISDESLEKAVNNALKLGFKVKMGKHIRAQRGFTAGTDQQRLDDLHLMFADDSVAGIWCARGGYGCSRLLPFLDYKLISRNPKALIGYSDITALLNAIYHKTGLVGFHGPVAASELTEYTEARFRAVVMEGAAPYAIPLSTANQEKDDEAYRTYPVRAGKARGRSSAATSPSWLRWPARNTCRKWKARSFSSKISARNPTASTACSPNCGRPGNWTKLPAWPWAFMRIASRKKATFLYRWKKRSGTGRRAWAFRLFTDYPSGISMINVPCRWGSRRNWMWKGSI